MIFDNGQYAYNGITTRMIPCIIAIENSQIRSGLKMAVEITFFHRWELHVKLLSEQNTGSLQTGLIMAYFFKWATNLWANVRKLEEHLNPKGGKMRIQPITLNQKAFGHFLTQSFHKGVE